MQKLIIEMPDGTKNEYVVIEREDGSKLTIEASDRNPEYVALTSNEEPNE